MSNGATPSTTIQPVTANGTPVEPQREYVSAGGGVWTAIARTARRLPWHLDDVTRDFGDDLYDRMLLDPQVAAAINVMKAAILEDGAHIVAWLHDESDPQFQQAQELFTFCEDVLENLDTPLDDVLWNLLDAIATGNRVAEQVYEQRGAQLVLRALKVKPRRSTAFVVDSYNNVLGLLGAIPGAPMAAGSLVVDPGQADNILPRDKFAVLTFRPKDHDPRGTSILRPAYNPWWLKMQTWPEYLKYLAQFASKSLIGTLPEGARSPTGVAESPAELMGQQLENFQNGSWTVIPNGAKIDMIGSDGEGGAFRRAFEMYDRQIVTAIINQTLTTMEGVHQSRAAASVHQDVFDTLIRQAKKSVERMLRRDVLMNLVRYNFGDAAVPLTPYVTLGYIEQQDKGAMIGAYAQGGYQFDPSQYPAIDEEIGVPPRNVAEQPQLTNENTNA